MEQYIDKSSVVAEIEKRMKKYTTIDVGNSSELEALYGAKCKALMEILSFLDTLEVKDEVVSTDPIKAMKDALCMEYEKGRADVLRDIDPDEMVADFCSQPLSKTRSLASIYRQGITDILRKINK